LAWNGLEGVELGIEERVRRAYELLKPLPLNLEEFVVAHASTLFERLVAVMLSQNTSDKQAIRALENLRRLLGKPLTPESLLETSLEGVAAAIRPVGMQWRRARNLQALAREVAARPSLLEEVEKLSVEEARRVLMKLPGVGPKTADVILLTMGKPTFPIDTHISRLAPRLLGLRELGYEEFRRLVVAALRSAELLRELHWKMIVVGRRWCRPRRPACSECPLRIVCVHAATSLETRGVADRRDPQST